MNPSASHLLHSSSYAIKLQMLSFTSHAHCVTSVFHLFVQSLMCTMPPERKSVASWISDYPGPFTHTRNFLYCRVCTKNIVYSKTFQGQVFTSQDCKRKGQCNNSLQRQLQVILLSKTDQDMFSKGLCQALLATNIPPSKLTNPTFQNVSNH